jgi:hypothetical protein
MIWTENGFLKLLRFFSTILVEIWGCTFGGTGQSRTPLFKIRPFASQLSHCLPNTHK